MLHMRHKQHISDIQLLGREYYLRFEPLAIWIPLFTHLAASTTRRCVISLKTKRLPPITPHLVTGWLLPFFLLPHIASHRLIPAASTSPIRNLSPAEFGFEFVGWGVNAWPVWTSLSYIGLVGVTVWHTGVGLMKVVSWLRRSRNQKQVEKDKALDSKVNEVIQKEQAPRKISLRRRIGLRGMLLGLLGVVALGLARVASENSIVSRNMEKRYQAVYQVLLNPFSKGS